MRKTMFRLLIIYFFICKYVHSIETIKAETECAKQCACTGQHILDLPLMKWHHMSIDKETQLNESTILNRALTILYGRDTLNKTIEYELSDFDQLLALDIQGYKNIDSLSDADVSLHHDALLNLHNLQFLNIEHVVLFPNPNTTSNEEPVYDQNLPPYDQLEHRRNELEQRRSKVNLVINTSPIPIVAYEEFNAAREDEGASQEEHSITFVLFDGPEIIPYDQFKKQQNLISTFSHLSKLRFLRLYSCHLESLTWDMFKDLSNLETLSLEGNNIVEIPKLAFISTPYLRTLILSANRLMHLDLESLAGLFELEHLDLSRNALHHLSESTFAPLPMLKQLDLRHNPLETIYSNTFEVMNTTKTLLVSSTRALNIHTNAFQGLDNLEKLVISGLTVDTLDRSLLHGMPKLKHLEIQGTVDNIDFDTFIDSLDLEVIILRNCSLRFISMDAFFALFDLKVLDLSWNLLESLPPGIFNQLDSLTELILSHNQFTELPGVLEPLRHVKMMRLDHNQWNCSCDMAHWRHLNWNRVKERREVDLPCNYKYDKIPCASVPTDVYVLNATVMPRCAAPAEFEGYSVLHVLNKRLRCQNKDGKQGDRETLKQPESQPKANTNGRRQIGLKQQRSKMEDTYSNKNEPQKSPEKNMVNEADDNLANNLDDLSQFIDNRQPLKSERR